MNLKDDSNGKILFAIYSCRKYLDRAEFLYRLLENTFDQNKVDVCIFFAKDDQGSIQTSCNHCILDCLDGYDNLTIKTLTLFSQCLSYKGIVKCDDDIFPNINYLRKFVNRLHLSPHIKYAGRRLDIESHIGTWHIGKGSNMDPIIIPECSYCTGPIYYLSGQAMRALVNAWTANLLVLNYNEDITVGHNLGILGIEPVHNPLYCDDPLLCDNLNIQNIGSQIPFVFARIHGGLGNQLFQCAAAVGIAKMTNRLPVLVFTESPIHYQHNKVLREYADTVFKDMCCISYEHVEKVINNNALCLQWSEVHSGVPPDACFTFQKDVIDTLNATGHHVFLNGYFQNENYFKDVKQELLGHFYDKKIAAQIAQKYPRVAESYFIHVRRGDYVGNKLYNIDYDAYLAKALKHLCANANTSLIHFYVVTNDVAYCKKHPLLSKYTILDDPHMSTLETLHFMSACQLGGICANSSFSWWGSYMNPCLDKRVYFPYEWMTNINVPIDVYPDNALVIKVKRS
jgi:hypothetical protein